MNPIKRLPNPNVKREKEKINFPGEVHYSVFASLTKISTFNAKVSPNQHHFQVDTSRKKPSPMEEQEVDGRKL